MKLELTVESMEDAVLGRAALDGLLSAYANRTHGTVAVQGTTTGRFSNSPRTASDSTSLTPISSTNTAPAADAGSTEPESADTGSPETGSTETEGTETESRSSGAKIGGFTKDQIKQAAEKNPTLAALVQGRGRKSDAQKAEIARLTAETLGISIPPEPIGAALKGATAQDLQAALAASTQVVHSEPAVEVRTAIPQTQPETQAPLVQQPVQTPAPAPAATSPIAGDSSLAELLAARMGGAAPAAAPVQAGTIPAAAPVQAGVMPPTPPLADATQYQQGKKPLDQMNADELLQAIRDYSDQGAGLFWFREVVTRSKAGDQNKMSVDYMRQVLTNPQAYYPNAV